MLPPTTRNFLSHRLPSEKEHHRTPPGSCLALVMTPNSASAALEIHPMYWMSAFGTLSFHPSIEMSNFAVSDVGAWKGWMYYPQHGRGILQHLDQDLIAGIWISDDYSPLHICQGLSRC